jgi:GGDEF domain-containing protein/phospholipid N-methyltransferase
MPTDTPDLVSEYEDQKQSAPDLVSEFEQQKTAQDRPDFTQEALSGKLAQPAGAPTKLPAEQPAPPVAIPRGRGDVSHAAEGYFPPTDIPIQGVKDIAEGYQGFSGLPVPLKQMPAARGQMPRPVQPEKQVSPEEQDVLTQQENQRAASAAKIITGAGEVGTVALPGSIAAAPVSTALSIGAGVLSSKAAGHAVHGKVSPQAEDLVRATAFFLPSVIGTAAGVKGARMETPQGKFSAVEALGGKVRAGIARTPDVTSGRVKIGDTQFEVNIPRSGQPAPAAPPPALDEATQAMVQYEQNAGNIPKPPPPVPPPTPGQQFGNKLSGDQVDHLAQTIAKAPPAQQNALIEEAHANMAKWINDNKGKVFIDGKIVLAKSPDQVEALAAKIINDASSAHDKAQELAAKEQEKAAKEQEKQSSAKAAQPSAPAPAPKPAAAPAKVDVQPKTEAPKSQPVAEKPAVQKVEEKPTSQVAKTEEPTTQNLPEKEATSQIAKNEVPDLVAQHEATPDLVAEHEAQPERRQNLAERKRVADLTPEERAHELLTSPKTGLPNDRAFEEDATTLAESHPHVGYADVDDFKQYNNALGHQGVDQAVLPAIGKLFADAAAKEPGGSVKVYHRSGDEFNFRSKTPEAIKRVVGRVNKELAGTTFKYQTKDGKIVEKKGTGLKHGIGSDHESAELDSELDSKTRTEAGLRSGERDVPAVDSRGAGGKQAPVSEDTGRNGVQSGRGETIGDRLAGRRSGKIGTFTLPDKTKLDLSVRPDISQSGTYSLVASNGTNSTSYRMQYKGGTPLSEVKKHFEDYLNTDRPGHKVTIDSASPASVEKPAVKPEPKTFTSHPRTAKTKLSADKLSDFQVGRDKVVREGNRTFVVDRSGSHARTEVQHDAITPEFKANADKLTPGQRERMIDSVKSTPYLSDEGRKERLEVLQQPSAPAVGSPEYEALKKRLAEVESKKQSPAKSTPAENKDGARIAARFRLTADSMEKQIDERQRSMTQNPTPKRMREYRSRLHDGENMKRVQKAMRALAAAHESGTVPKGLENLRTKDDIYRLVYKGVEGGGGYYDVIPSQEYANKTPQGKALQELMESSGKETSAEKAAKGTASKISQLEADVQFQKLPGYFPTPKPVVEKMLNEADIQPGDKVLEPSAGKGNIADLIREREPEAHLSTIEQQSKLRQILELKGHELAGSDFLEHDGKYDKIVMNPPFENGQDIEHVQRAFGMLKPGGKLVAIMSESPFFRSDRKGQAFRDWLEEHNGTSEKLEPGAFKESGTGVNARMVVIEKPEAKAAGTTAKQEARTSAPAEDTAIKQFDQAIEHTGAEVKTGKPSEAFAEKIKEATHLEPANDAELKEKFTGAAYQREYFKAALQTAKDAWAGTMNGKGNGAEMFDFIADKGLTSYDEKQAPEGFKTRQFYIKVPDDGHFLVNNWPNAIARALKGATRGFAAPRQSFNPEAKPKKFSVPKATPEAVEKYRKELADELKSAEADKSYAEHRLQNDKESRAKSRELTDEFNKDLKHLRASDDPKRAEKERELRDAFNKSMQRLPRQMSDDEIAEAKQQIEEASAQIPTLRQNVKDFDEQFPATIPASESRPAPGARAAHTGNETGLSEIEQLTNSLKNNTPKSSLGDRLREGAKLGAKGAAGELNGSIGKLKGTFAALLDALKRPPKAGDYEDATGKWSGADQRSALYLNEFTKAGEKSVPSKLKQEAISNWIEAGGDDAVLQSRADQSKPKYKPGYEAALKLTDAEKTIARNIMGLHDATLQEAIKAGIVEAGVENYIQHIYDQPKLLNRIRAEMNFSSLQTKPAFSKKRTLPTYFDAEQLGFTPKNKSVFFLTAAHERSLREALAARDYVRALMDGEAEDGRPLTATNWASAKQIEGSEEKDGAYVIKANMKPGGDFSGYLSIDHPALRKWNWSGEIDGKPVFVQGDVLVHPDIYRKLKNNLGTSALRRYEVELGSLTIHPGAMALNAQAQIKQFVLSFSGFHQTTLGVHALEHKVLPAGMPELDLSQPEQAGLVDGGLMVAHYDAMEAFGEGVSSGGLVTKIPAIGPMYKTYTDYLFKSYMPRLKMQMALAALERNQARYPDLSKQQLYRLTASQANAAFGGLNYRMIGRNKTFQDTLRLILMAPDFTEARARFAAQAAKPYGREQLVALMLGAAVLYAVARIINEMSDGQPHWDKPFSVVSHGKEYELRTIQSDMINAATDPKKFLQNRVSPPVSAIFKNDDPHYKKKNQSIGDQIKSRVDGMVPVPAEPWMRNSKDSNATKAMESILKMVGVNSKKEPKSHR